MIVPAWPATGEKFFRLRRIVPEFGSTVGLFSPGRRPTFRARFWSRLRPRGRRPLRFVKKGREGAAGSEKTREKGGRVRESGETERGARENEGK